MEQRSSTRNAYFGDLHVHTKYSFDAYIYGTRNDPDDAYRYARGETLTHAAGIEMRLEAPLDFLAVADHATYLGMFEQMDSPDSGVSRHPLSIALRSAETPDDRAAVFREVLPRQRGYVDPDDLLDLGIVGSAWREIIEAAERHNDPGTFTTLIAYEFTGSGPSGENLHRNVIFRGSNVPGIPFSRVDARNNPEKLWDWMDQQRARGIESLAIPHNSNGSDGWMFQLTDREGNAIDQAYAERRMRNEPLVEVTQVKGTSDTHPLLSPNDEWADFGIIKGTIGNDSRSRPQGSYVRDAYLNGLAMEEEQGFNPFRFGLVGSSDTHNAAGSFGKRTTGARPACWTSRRSSEGRFPGPKPASTTTGPLSTGAPRVWPPCGPNPTPGKTSFAPSNGRRPLPRPALACGSASSPATTSTRRRWPDRTGSPGPTPTASPWEET